MVRLILFSVVCCYSFLSMVTSQTVTSKLLDESNTTASSDGTVADLLIAYFRYHGVLSLNFVVCHEHAANQSKHQHQQLLSLVRLLTMEGFYVRVSKGDECIDGNETIPSKPSFGPTSTIRNDNATKRPLRFHLEPLTYKSGIVLLRFDTPCTLNILRWSATSENNFFTTNRFWLLLTATVEHIQFLDDDDIFLPPDSEVRILVYPLNNVGGFELIDVYKISPNKPIKRTNIANNSQSLNVSDLIQGLQRFGSAISHRGNLEGIIFNTGVVIAFPDVFTGIEDVSLRHIDTISKVNHPITLEMANQLNISFNTYQTDNYGWRQPNNSFDGLMGRLQLNKLDFGQCGLFMRLDRIAVVDFVAETFHIRAGIMFRQPPLSAVSNIFAMPFQRDVWIAILLLILFTTFVLGMELMFSPYIHFMDIWDCVIFVWGALCQQGFHVTISNRSARIIIFITFIVTLFLYTSFSANIVALLQTPSEAIQSLEDLIQSPLEIGVQDTVYNKIYFNESTDPVTSRLYHKKIAPKGENVFMRPLMGMKKMRSELFAYQVELQAGYKIISDTFSEVEKCGLKELEPFQLPLLAIPTRKNFPYKELFRRQIRWQREVGLMNREELKWFPQKPKCEGGVGGFVSIGITECRYAFEMFGIGIFLGFIMFCFELAYKYFLNMILAAQTN